MLAEIGVRMGIYDDAEFLLESCVEFAPEHVQARIDYVNILIRKTRFEKHINRQSCCWNGSPVIRASKAPWQARWSGSAGSMKGLPCSARCWKPTPTAPNCTCRWTRPQDRGAAG